MRGVWLALALVAGPARVATAQQVPNELVGIWVIEKVVGADPGFLEVRNKTQLVGKRIVIAPTRLQLWTLMSAVPNSFSVTEGTLDQILSVPPEVSQEARFDGDDGHFVFYGITSGSCVIDGQASKECPIEVFAKNPSTGEIGFVTNPWGMARLRKVEARPGPAVPAH